MSKPDLFYEIALRKLQETNSDHMTKIAALEEKLRVAHEYFEIAGKAVLNVTKERDAIKENYTDALKMLEDSAYTDALKMLEEMVGALEDSKQIILDREKELDSAQYITVAEVECCIDDALESYRKFKGD